MINFFVDAGRGGDVKPAVEIGAATGGAAIVAPGAAAAVGLDGVEEGGGVAYFAHIGGFVFGIATVRLFQPRRPPGVPRSSW